MQYQADTTEAIAFTHTFPSQTTLVGPSSVFIDISAPDHDDLDIYTHVFKADKNGTILTHQNIPVPETLSPEEVKMTTNALFCFWDPAGMLRASQRHISIEKSTKTWKTLSHEYIQKVQPGEVVKLEIQLWPASIIFEPREQLILKISGDKLRPPALPLGKEPNQNKGEHVVHLGGKFDSRLEFITLDV